MAVSRLLTCVELWESGVCVCVCCPCVCVCVYVFGDIIAVK